MKTPHKCPVCNGSGEVQQTDIDWDDCRSCNGTGIVWSTDDLPEKEPTTDFKVKLGFAVICKNEADFQKYLSSIKNTTNDHEKYYWFKVSDEDSAKTPCSRFVIAYNDTAFYGSDIKMMGFDKFKTYQNMVPMGLLNIAEILIKFNFLA